MKETKGKKSVYIFHRVEGWYPLELYGNKDARQQALNNPGTLKVTDAQGNTVWKPDKPS